MPLVRSPSTGDTLRISDDSDELNVGQTDSVRQEDNPNSHIVTRRRAQLAAMGANSKESTQVNRELSIMNEEHVRSIVSDSFMNFRTEITRSISEEIRNVISNTVCISDSANGGIGVNPQRQAHLTQSVAVGRPTSLEKEYL